VWFGVRAKGGVGSSTASERGGFPAALFVTRRALETRIPRSRPLYSLAMLWRIPPPSRSRRLPPAGFIQPARPLLTTTPRSGPEWIHEVKHDGYRLIPLFAEMALKLSACAAETLRSQASA
jgi:hypothetical protein